MGMKLTQKQMEEVIELLNDEEGARGYVVVLDVGDDKPIVVLPKDTIRNVIDCLGIPTGQVKKFRVIGKFPSLASIVDADIRGDIAEAIGQSFFLGVLSERGEPDAFCEGAENAPF